MPNSVDQRSYFALDRPIKIDGRPRAGTVRGMLRRLPAVMVPLLLLTACGPTLPAPAAPVPKIPLDVVEVEPLPTVGAVEVRDATPPPVAIGADGYFVLNGRRTVVYGLEEEHHVYTEQELDLLVPALRELGVTFLVVYRGNVQQDFFYERFEREGLWVAQELGNVKKRVASPFAGTGGVLGTVPDEETIASNLQHIDELVGRLARHRSILFWWIGGEFAERDFHTPAGEQAVRASVALYADAVRARDPLGRPFTVSHHYVEALEDALLPFIDFSDLTDFTWFTVATHFHSCDFIEGGGWYPLARASEVPLALEVLLARAWQLNHERPVFFGGWYAQAPLLGACSMEHQAEGMREKWRVLSTVPSMGASAYHLAEWQENGIPHAMLEWRDGALAPTSAGTALREILAAAPH